MTQEKMSLEPGTRFKTRVVVEEAGKDKFNNTLYLTRCDCGYEQVYRGSYLKENKACKACRDRTSISERKDPFDFIGDTFNDLTLLSITDRTRSNKTIAIFKCICGEIVEKIASEVLCGTVKSCGCRKLKSSSQGKRVGSFRVIDKSHRDSTKRRTYYNCICDCGKTFLTESAELHNGKKRSCGCTRYESAKIAACKPIEIAATNRIYANYKRSAKTRGLVFDIPKCVFISIIKLDCFYCGIAPSASYKNNRGDFYVWNGIDRIDNSEGYVVDNIVPCCKNCNYAKTDQSQHDFYMWIDRVYHTKVKAYKKTLSSEGLLED